MSDSTLKERMKARRQRMRDTTDSVDADPSPRRTPRQTSWDAEIDEDDVEAKQSEDLARNLQKRHKRTKRQLESTLQTIDDGEDVTEELQVAKRRTKEKIQEEARKTDDDDDDEGEDSEAHSERDETEPMEGEDGSAMDTTIASGRSLSPPESARSVTRGTTPRAVSSNLGQSYRQRLLQKRQAAKDKAKDETYGTRRLAGMRGMPRATRFDDPNQLRFEEEEEDIEKKISQVSWKRLLDKAKEKAVEKPSSTGLPTQVEAYDFFTKQFEPEPEPEPEPPKPTEEEEATEEAPAAAGSPTEGGEGEDQPPADTQEEEQGGEDTEGEDSRKKKKKKKDLDEEEEPLLGDDLDIEADAWRFYSMGHIEYRPFRERLQDEQKVLFYPSIREAKLEDKIFGAEEARYLEEEGFYVGTRPNVPQSNVSKMENRLLKQGTEGAKKWFGEDGRLIALPDPLKEVPSRPYIMEEIEPALQTDYQKAEVKEFDARFIDGSSSARGGGRYQLDVDVNTVAFSHHHLFSREHVLAARLSQLYAQYVSRSTRKTADYLTEKLRALKGAAQHVEETIATIKARKRGKVADVSDQASRLAEYRDEIRSTRRLRDAELHADRTLMRHIIDTWKDMKALRGSQGCSNTNLKLQIRKEPSDKKADEAAWEEDVMDEVAEMKESLEAEYNRELEQYRAQLEKWKQQRLAKKEAHKREKERAKKKKRHRSRSRSSQNPEEDEDEEMMHDEEDEELAIKDREVIEEEDLVKPEKPKFIEDTEARQKVEQKFAEIRRKPGEPLLFPVLSSDAPITAINLCPGGEKSRRNDVSRYKVFCKVLFNGKEVSRTPAKPLGQDFNVRFAQIFNVEIVQWPENIKLEIYETTPLTTSLLSEVHLLIPEANVTAENVTLDEMDFSSEQRESHGHEGVGSGVSFTTDAAGNTLTLMTTGTISTAVGWGLDSQGTVLVPPTITNKNQLYNAMKGLDAIAGIGMTGMADMDKLTKWISESRLDPNDPSNAQLMHLMRPAGGDKYERGMRLPEHFRLEQLLEEFNFCTDEYLEHSKRFRLIKLREQEVPEFRNKIVPAYDKEVSEETFAEYEKRLRADDKLKEMDELESHRVAVAKFMQKVRETVMLRFRVASHQKTLQEMIDEDLLPKIDTLIPNLMKLFEPRRPLRPRRKDRKKVTPQNLQGTDAVKILVNIVRAFDIPVRADSSQLQSGDPSPVGMMGATSPLSPRGGGESGMATARGVGGAGGAGTGVSWAAGTLGGGGTGPLGGTTPVANIAGDTLVRPFIEAMFQRNTVQTSVADGPNPSWNEELQIPFKAPNNDYSPSNLQTCNDILFLNLFDEYIIDMSTTDQDRGTTIHRRIEKKWLGSLKIPFSTIYFNSRIDGTFRINKPPVLLGYTHDTRNTKTDLGLDVGIGSGEHTYVSLFVTIEPPLTLAEPIKERFDSNEDEKLLDQAFSWQDSLLAKFPKREYKTTVVDINGNSVFLTRFFKPLKPPEQFLEASDPISQAEAVARYVSLIPFVSDSVVFPGLCDIWSTCDQFLQMLQGDEEEHAVLLTCYFLYLGKPAWIILGCAIPEGATAYVLTQENNDYWIWNPSTGEHFSCRDNYCPVTSIGCLANAENIWGNIQPNDQPSRIAYDLSNTKNWRPFFHKGFPSPGLSSIQPETLLYFPTERQFVVELQEKIEQRLREGVMSWRPKHITRWNRYCMQAFRRLLVKLETSGRSRGVQQEHAAELEQVLGSYKLCGFPINMPYTEMSPLIDAVYATGVHNQESSDIEFALAVHIHPYPNNVLSVWIYVASLVRKR